MRDGLTLVAQVHEGPLFASALAWHRYLQALCMRVGVQPWPLVGAMQLDGAGLVGVVTVDGQLSVLIINALSVDEVTTEDSAGLEQAMDTE